MAEVYYKSRAMLLARLGSTFASGMTTLAAVLPLLAAVIGPLRIFGIIFTIVGAVALIFALGLFSVILMIFGPGLPLLPVNKSHATSEEGAGRAASSVELVNYRVCPNSGARSRVERRIDDGDETSTASVAPASPQPADSSCAGLPLPSASCQRPRVRGGTSGVMVFGSMRPPTSSLSLGGASAAD